MRTAGKQSIRNILSGIALHTQLANSKRNLGTHYNQTSLQEAYSWECIIRRLWSIDVVIWMHKLLTTLMAKNLRCSVCNNLNNYGQKKISFFKYITVVWLHKELRKSDNPHSLDKNINWNLLFGTKTKYILKS